MAEGDQKILLANLLAVEDCEETFRALVELIAERGGARAAGVGGKAGVGGAAQAVADEELLYCLDYAVRRVGFLK